ncbi:endonuclease/exonuclease/phosphatase family protein [Membranihabitans maritimus]|uniref:endonuclease/exonuclease/phosphatase family protein n=1 Tax=Membranihabitans maritimus TaxID=2904244 RepID=UPI001F3B922F|nr:endonuclease/exonuclease/phosphatase family protein [Membranihabitans maritimus]
MRTNTLWVSAMISGFSFFFILGLNAQNLKVISYNIWEGMKMDTTEGKVKFSEWIKSQDPDVLALQEVNYFTQSKLENIARSYGHPYAVLLKETGYPVAITSKFPIVNVEKVLDNMHHGFIKAEIEGVSYMVVHLSPHKYWKRREEVKTILSTIDHNPTKEDWVILGDFNSLSPGNEAFYKTSGLVERMKESAARYSSHENLEDGKLDYEVIRQVEENGYVDIVGHSMENVDFSFPTKSILKDGDKASLRRIDYIFLSPGLENSVTNARIIKDDFTDMYSDHYPVMVELKVN